MRLNFILEDYTIFKNAINESDNEDLKVKIDSRTEIINSITDIGFITFAEVKMEKEDLSDCVTILMDEHNKNIWTDTEEDTIKEIIMKITSRAENVIA